MNCFPCRILAVEDEMMVLMLIEDMLSDLGCEAVTIAATVPQALTLIGAQVFDAAMLDMNLNGDKTTSVADALSARDVPFFFSTGYSGRDMRDGYRDRPLLIKPFRFEKLTEIFTELFPDRSVLACNRSPAALVTATKVVRVSNIDQNLANPKRIMVKSPPRPGIYR